MILCSRSNCPRVYHLGCLGLTAPPKGTEIILLEPLLVDVCSFIYFFAQPPGTWHCPWHFCERCGDVALYMCSRCPTSYCVKHNQTDDGQDLIRVSDLDSNRWFNTLKCLEGRMSDPVDVAKNATALILRCRWICHLHDGVLFHLPNSGTEVKEEESIITESQRVDESVCEHVKTAASDGSQVGSISAGENKGEIEASNTGNRDEVGFSVPSNNFDENGSAEGEEVEKLEGKGGDEKIEPRELTDEEKEEGRRKDGRVSDVTDG